MLQKMAKWMNKLNKKKIIETKEINFYFKLGFKV